MIYLDASVVHAQLLAEDRVREQGLTISLATFDERLRGAAVALDIPIYPLE